MRENVTRIRSISCRNYNGFSTEKEIVDINDPAYKSIISSPMEKTLLEIMEECGVDAPLVNIYRYDGDRSEFRERIEECLSVIDTEKCIIISEAYGHSTDHEGLQPFSNSSAYLDSVSQAIKNDCMMFKSLGFIDISFYSDYDYGTPFLYRNKLTDKIYEYMCSKRQDQSMYGLNLLFKLDIKDKNEIKTVSRCIGDGLSENFYSGNDTCLDINGSIEKHLLEDNDHVKIEISYTKIADLQFKSNNMKPVSKTRADLTINNVLPGTITLYITDKLANNQITNMILLDVCDRSIQIHWRRFTNLSEHVVASTDFSVVNLIRSELYWNDSNTFNLVFRLPDPKTITKPIFVYLLPENTDFTDKDRWNPDYIDIMLHDAIYTPKGGIYCETNVDDSMMKQYTFRDMLTGEITHTETKNIG